MKQKSKALNVLSIDFDVFQKVDIDTMQTCYPDGVDLPTSISSFVWQSHYANPDTYQKLMKITPDIDMVNALKRLIGDNKHMPDSFICNSHKNIYDFIMEHFHEGNYDKIELTHLDMHHDMVNDNSELDCGNWVSYLEDAVKTNVTWIANPISKAMYGMTEPIFDTVRTDLSNITKPDWNLIFLCRSDNWLPPHLDSSFIDLAVFIMNTSVSCQYEDGILQSRWNENFQNGFEQIRDTYRNLEQIKEISEHEQCKR